MSTATVIYILLALVTALLLALFQYVYKSTLKGKLKYVLFGLRAMAWFCAFLILINPKVESFTYYNEKPTLVVAVDNSESLAYLNQTENAKNALNAIQSNSNLQSRFNIEYYNFGKSITQNDSLSFSERQSNLSEAIKQFNDVYTNNNAPIVLLTDGNQTFGTDYSYVNSSQPIYSVILGDSIRHTDLSIKQVNVNRYAYLKNKFPVEIITNYSGNESIKSELKIFKGKSLINKKIIDFNFNKTSNIITVTLEAKQVGVSTYRVELTPLNDEKNTVNNIKNFAVEVIDQKTKIALISDIIHPDLGALKKSIETNEQRSVTILKPKDYLNQINDFQLTILYQPNLNFSEVYKRIQKQNVNTFTVVGTATNWAFLNASQNYFKQKVTNQTEDYQPSLNKGYNTFIVNNIDFENYPPITSEFGAFSIETTNDVLLYKTINGIGTNDALLATFEDGQTKHGILNGEGIWRWRAQAFLDNNSFIAFDNVINKIVQYLSSNKRRQRINIDYKSFYNGNDDIVISAQYFNKNFEFDAEASLIITLKNKSDATTRDIPLLPSKGNYTVDLSGVKAGDYDFTIRHNFEAISKSGSFTVLEYNVEKQFLNANVEKLQNLSNKTQGEAVFYDNAETIITNLLADTRYKTIQKSTKNIVYLKDWKYLLFLIVLCLSLEWFMRKYNGLI